MGGGCLLLALLKMSSEADLRAHAALYLALGGGGGFIEDLFFLKLRYVF